MSEITGAQLTLATTPTAGASGEHSPYYRRLLSAGYKGFLQGTVGGATFYGLLGLGIGALVAAPLAIFAAPAIAASAWTLIPVMGGLGLMKGASTFGQIGSVAAINAETAEVGERRRYLLERYYALPNDPAYAAEAEQIRTMLTKQHETHRPMDIFHWKTMLTCAALGAAICLGFVAFAALAPELLVAAHLAPILGALHLTSATGAIVASSVATATAVSAGIGGLAGAVIGLDRYYVRKWFDGSENLISDNHGRDREIAARAREVERLEELSPDRGIPKQTIKVEVREPNPIDSRHTTVTPIGGHESRLPGKQVNTVQLESRLADINVAMARPVA